MKMLLILFALLWAGDDLTRSILTLSGASCIEELSEDEIGRYQLLSEHPVDLNIAPRSKLLAAGILSTWQVTSIISYRIRCGDIMSFAELGLIEGFTPSIAEALRPFVTLSSNNPPSRRQDERLSQTITARAAGRNGPEYSGGLKYSAEYGDRAALYWSPHKAFDDKKMSPGSVSAAYFGRRFPGKVILGNFNVRFGQGLAMWSGFSLSGFPSVSAFRRNGSGISPASSFSPEFTGLAADCSFGRWTISAGYSFRGNMAVANLTRVGKLSTEGITATREAVSLDWQISMPDVSFFGEAAFRYTGSLSAVSGLIWTPAYGKRFALQGRWHGPDSKLYSGIAAGMELPWLTLTVDAGCRRDISAWQYKAVMLADPVFTLSGLTLRPAVHLGLRRRPSDEEPCRIDLRPEFSAEWRGWRLGGRYNALWGKKFAWLWYIESGYRGDALGIYLRGGIFKVDDWADRIYVYERDAPGSYNVPAYYGRGWNASLFSEWKIGRRHSIWLRLETVNYPWNQTPKPFRTEIKIQYRLRL